MAELDEEHKKCSDELNALIQRIASVTIDDLRASLQEDYEILSIRLAQIESKKIFEQQEFETVERIKLEQEEIEKKSKKNAEATGQNAEATGQNAEATGQNAEARVFVKCPDLLSSLNVASEIKEILLENATNARVKVPTDYKQRRLIALFASHFDMKLIILNEKSEIIDEIGTGETEYTVYVCDDVFLIEKK